MTDDDKTPPTPLRSKRPSRVELALDDFARSCDGLTVAIDAIEPSTGAVIVDLADTESVVHHATEAVGHAARATRPLSAGGKWTITISGSGPHHNANHPTDANVLAGDLVRDLVMAGHRLDAATFATHTLDEIGDASREDLLRGYSRR